MNYFWNSQDSLSGIVNFLDYAGLVDTIAAVVLLILVFAKPKQAGERKWTIFATVLSFLAGVLWVADAKCAHRLSDLQQKESSIISSNQLGEINQLKAKQAEAESKLAESEKARGEALQAAAEAKAAAILATNVVNSANVAVIQHLDRHLTDSQKGQLFAALKDIPKNESFSFNIDPTVPDAKAFSTDIAQVLIASGFKLDQGNVSGGITVGSSPMIIISTSGSITNTPLGLVLRDSLKRMGWRTALIEGHGVMQVPDGEIRIDVGRKQE